MCDNKSIIVVDQNRKKHAENMVINGINSAQEGLAILRNEKLYLDEYPTFEEYCQKKLNKSIRQVQRLLTHQNTQEDLRKENSERPIGRVPETVINNLPESATRELGGLTTADKLETIKKASENGKKTPTAKEIKEARTMDEPTEANIVETNTIEVDREELDRLKEIESEYEKLKSRKPVKTCPHCRKDTSKQPAKTIHAPQQFDRTQEKKELSEYFA